MTEAVAGYVAVGSFPLSEILKPWRHASAWDGVLGGDPLTGTTDAWRYLALGVPAAPPILAGAWLFGRQTSPRITSLVVKLRGADSP
jgi:hypothetical protein